MGNKKKIKKRKKKYLCQLTILFVTLFLHVPKDLWPEMIHLFTEQSQISVSKEFAFSENTSSEYD